MRLGAHCKRPSLQSAPSDGVCYRPRGRLEASLLNLEAPFGGLEEAEDSRCGASQSDCRGSSCGRTSRDLVANERLGLPPAPSSCLSPNDGLLSGETRAVTSPSCESAWPPARKRLPSRCRRRRQGSRLTESFSTPSFSPSGIAAAADPSPAVESKRVWGICKGLKELWHSRLPALKRRIDSSRLHLLRLTYKDPDLEEKFKSDFYSNKAHIRAIKQALIIFLVSSAPLLPAGSTNRLFVASVTRGFWSRPIVLLGDLRRRRSDVEKLPVEREDGMRFFGVTFQVTFVHSSVLSLSLNRQASLCGTITERHRIFLWSLRACISGTGLFLWLVLRFYVRHPSVSGSQPAILHF